MLRALLIRRLAQRSGVPARRLVSTNISIYASHPLPSPPAPLGQYARRMSTPPPQVNTSELDIDRYHDLADATMDTLLGSLEDLLEILGNREYEVEYHSGVLTLDLGESGIYVINKQPPNKQIWLSSPFSGPKRYDYCESNDTWICLRDGKTLGNLLEEELGSIAGKYIREPVTLRLENVSKL